MDLQKVSLLIASIESSLEVLKMELSSSNIPSNIIKLENLIPESIDDYEPDYHEED